MRFNGYYCAAAIAALTLSTSAAQDAAPAGVDEVTQLNGSVLLKAGSYHVQSQMVLPHLDEMRRISEHRERCLAAADAQQLFPVFEQPALTGCRLDLLNVSANEHQYALVCVAVNGGSGSAKLKFDGHHLKASLDAKMGGKNMTFSQYVQAEWQGPCTAADAVH